MTTIEELKVNIFINTERAYFINTCWCSSSLCL